MYEFKAEVGNPDKKYVCFGSFQPLITWPKNAQEWIGGWLKIWILKITKNKDDDANKRYIYFFAIWTWIWKKELADKVH